jgi:hypothetical protein
MYILSACGGFLFSPKSVARGALLHLFCQNAPFPPKKKCPAGEAPIGLLERPHPPSAGTTKSQRRVGTRKRPKTKNQN